MNPLLTITTSTLKRSFKNKQGLFFTWILPLTLILLIGFLNESKMITQETAAGVMQIRYIDFLVPGIMAMTIMQLGIFSTAFSLVDYRQKGILKRILVTPVSSWQFIFGNMLARLLLSLSQAAIIIGVSYFVFDVQFHHWLTLLSIVILGNIVFLSLGLCISGIARTTESVPIMSNLIIFPMLLLGGIFYNPENLPKWLEHISNILPVSLIANTVRAISSHGASISSIRIQLLCLLGWGIAALFLANRFFSMQEKK